jgi:hypothetical protein
MKWRIWRSARVGLACVARVRLFSLRDSIRFVAVLCVLMSCAEPTHSRGPSTQAAPSAIVPHLVVSSVIGQDVIVTVSIEVHGDVGRVGSLTADVSYDSTALAFQEAVALNDGAMRAVNPTAGLLRFAVISSQGLDAERLAEFHFHVRDAAALARMQLEIRELHTLSRSDLKALVTHSSNSARP